MKNKLVLYLLVSLVASCIYPVTVWAKVNERFSLKNESVSEQIPLTKKVSRKTRSILIYNPQIQISAESETKRSIFREKDKTKRSKKESAQHSKSRNKSFVMTSVSAL